MVFALKQGKQAASREFWIDTTPLSVEPPLVAVDGTTSYLGNMGCSRLSSTVTGIVYRGPFCSMFRTIRDPRLPRRVSTRHQYPSSPPPAAERGGRFTRRDVTERATFTGTIGDPKQKETERRAFELNYFHFRTRSASLFVPANGIHRDAVAMGRVGFRPRSAVYPSLSLSLYDWERGNGRDGEDRGFRSRWRESAFQVSLPFTVSSRAAFDIFIFWNYHVRLFFSKLFKESVDEKFQRWQETRSNDDILFCN